jgi:site-specific DNA-adenine methylase
MAAAIWARLGDTPNYVEPFMGSAAVLLARPHDLTGKTETANDIDGFLTCSYRAIQYAPDEVAYYCDRPVNEIDLTAYHLWLKSLRTDLTERLFADPFYYDAQVAGAFLWGIASWIGDGWCVADGPWINVDGRLVDRRTMGASGAELPRQMPAVAYKEFGPPNGVQKYRASVPRKMPEIGRSPNGQMQFNRKGVQAYRHHEGVPKQMPVVSARGDLEGAIKQGVNSYKSDSALASYFARLSDRLRRVRFLCGDWRRACKDSVTVNHGLTAVFLDPPYPQAEHDMAYHSEEAGDVWHAAAAWAIERGDDRRLRICIAGYHSEATDALFPATWERVRWEARGGYANQKADGRGRANAKRETLWFSPSCLDVAAEARAAFSRPIAVKESDYTGTMFDVEETL